MDTSSTGVRHVLVVGGNGLIGRATIGQLADLGVGITVLSRTRGVPYPEGVRWIQCDVTDRDRLLEILCSVRPDAVLHLAALLQYACESDPVSAVRINVDGTLHVLEACRTAGVARVVFGSSIAVYGQTDTLTEEDDWTAKDVNVYGMSKLMGESIGAAFARRFGLSFVSLRYSGVFGPEPLERVLQGSPGMSLVRKKVIETVAGTDVEIDGASGAEQIHLTFVDDAAEATTLALLRPCPTFAVYNVGGPPENYVTLEALHSAVKALVPTAGKVIWKGAGRTAPPLALDRIARDLHFHPKVSLAEGLKAMLGMPAGIA